MRQWEVIGPAIAAGRLAHALLLIGPRGTGKRHFATLLARSILCRQPGADGLACGQCQSCVLAEAGTHPDLYRLEKEEGSKVVKVGDLREFNRKVFLTPQLGHGSVGIIDPVEGLNRSSANALLKSLEEPPAGVHILLIGERWMTLPATLRSRCVIVRFPRVEAGPEPEGTAAASWTESLASLCVGKQDPVALAEHWSRQEEAMAALIDGIHACISDALKIAMGVPERFLGRRDSLPALRLIASRMTTDRLSRLSAVSLETRRLIETQARPQMLLENLLASWYQSSGSRK